MGDVVYNIGFDFGTTYTKIAYYDPALREMNFITWDIEHPNGVEYPFFPSKININKHTGKLSLPKLSYNKNTNKLIIVDEPDSVGIPYIKMGVAGFAFTRYHNLDDRVLMFYYLSCLLKETKEYILQIKRDRIRGQEIEWSGDICVPDKYYKTDLSNLFSRIFTAAWDYANSTDTISIDYNIVSNEYRRRVDSGICGSNFSSYPEIAAAIQSFANSREIREGIYIYFDIGGGTVDGVSFRLKKGNDSPTLSFYAGEVEKLGIDLVSLSISKVIDQPYNVIKLLLKDRAAAGKLKKEVLPNNEMHTLTAKVVVESRNKDIHEKIKSAKTLPIYIGGGGADYYWYRNTIETTHGKRQHENLSIPPYELRDIFLPQNIPANMKAYYPRLAIAYGLATTNRIDIDGFPNDFVSVNPNKSNREEYYRRLQDIQREKYGGRSI